ncbi:MAG: ABC transporter substrate-binding protein [Chloroflexi bacterium]|nr:ABC transporter substrate-binding protein [Chloroflexota bacterium]
MKALRSSLVPWLGILALLLAACGPAATATPVPAAATATPRPTTPIKIALMGEFTGPFAAVQKMLYDTLEWMFQQDGNKVAGRPLEFIKVDDEGKVDVFQSKTQRILEIDKVQLVVGPIHSGIAATARDWIAQQPTVWVIPEVGTVQFYPGPNAVRSVATSWHSAQPDIGKYLAETYGIKKAVTIGLDYAAGRDYVKGETEKVLPGGNIQLVQQFWTPIGTADFGPILSKIPTGQDVMITGALWGADSVRFMKQATEFGIKDKVKIIAFPASFAVDDIGLAPLGKDAEGIFNYNEMPPPDFPNPQWQKFVTDFRAKFNLSPGYAWKGYVTYLQLKQAIEAVKGNVEDRDALIKALRQPLNTPVGTLTFDACGNGIMSLFLKKVLVTPDGKAQTSFVKDFPNASIPCPQPPEWK